MKARRAARAVAARVAADALIAGRLDAMVAASPASVIAGYWAMRDEPELVAALTRWHEAGRIVALPRVAGPGAPLAFGRWHPGARLAAGPFGTRQVEPHDDVVPELIVLPCLGFDARCYRLGYGGGFYDRTLEGLPRARTIGVAYDDCEIRAFREAAHDRPLDHVVTERRVIARVPA